MDTHAQSIDGLKILLDDPDLTQDFIEAMDNNGIGHYLYYGIVDKCSMLDGKHLYLLSNNMVLLFSIYTENNETKKQIVLVSSFKDQMGADLTFADLRHFIGVQFDLLSKCTVVIYGVPPKKR